MAGGGGHRRLGGNVRYVIRGTSQKVPEDDGGMSAFLVKYFCGKNYLLQAGGNGKESSAA